MPSSSSASVKPTEHKRPSSDQLYNYHNPQSPNLFTSSGVIMSEARLKRRQTRRLMDSPVAAQRPSSNGISPVPADVALSGAQPRLASKRERAADAAVKPQRPDLRRHFNVTRQWKRSRRNTHVSERPRFSLCCVRRYRFFIFNKPVHSFHTVCSFYKGHGTRFTSAQMRAPPSPDLTLCRLIRFQGAKDRSFCARNSLTAVAL